MEVILGVVLGILGSLFVVPLFSQQALSFIVFLFGPIIKGKQSIAGEWQQRWWRDGHFEDAETTESFDTTLRQLGNRVTGSFNSVGRKYRLEGKISRDMFITGTWSDDIEGVTYHGAFQLQILIHADTMSGRWVGFSADGKTINAGIWEWKRKSTYSYPSDTQGTYS